MSRSARTAWIKITLPARAFQSFSKSRSARTAWIKINSDEDFTAVYEIEGKIIKNGAPDSQVYSSEELLDGTWKTEDLTFKFGR